MGGGSRRKTVNAVTSGGSCSESSNSLAERTIRCSSAGMPEGFCRASFTMATLESGATWILMMFPAIVEISKSLNSSVLGILEPGSSLRDREGMRASGIKYTSKEMVVGDSISTALTWSKFILSHKFCNSSPMSSSDIGTSPSSPATGSALEGPQPCESMAMNVKQMLLRRQTWVKRNESGIMYPYLDKVQSQA